MFDTEPFEHITDMAKESSYQKILKVQNKKIAL
jgi:hypothetical protein